MTRHYSLTTVSAAINQKQKTELKNLVKKFECTKSNMIIAGLTLLTKTPYTKIQALLDNLKGKTKLEQ